MEVHVLVARRCARSTETDRTRSDTRAPCCGAWSSAAARARRARAGSAPTRPPCRCRRSASACICVNQCKQRERAEVLLHRGFVQQLGQVQQIGQPALAVGARQQVALHARFVEQHVQHLREAALVPELVPAREPLEPQLRSRLRPSACAAALRRARPGSRSPARRRACAGRTGRATAHSTRSSSSAVSLSNTLLSPSSTVGTPSLASASRVARACALVRHSTAMSRGCTRCAVERARRTATSCTISFAINTGTWSLPQPSADRRRWACAGRRSLPARTAAASAASFAGMCSRASGLGRTRVNWISGNTNGWRARSNSVLTACDQARVGAVVDVERVRGLPARARGLQVREHVGAAEAVDRLLRIADQEQAAPGARVQALEDLVLHRVGVLELVDQRGRVALGHALGERCAARAFERGAQRLQQIVEAVHAEIAVSLHDLAARVVAQTAPQREHAAPEFAAHVFRGCAQLGHRGEERMRWRLATFVRGIAQALRGQLFGARRQRLRVAAARARRARLPTRQTLSGGYHPLCSRSGTRSSASDPLRARCFHSAAARSRAATNGASGERVLGRRIGQHRHARIAQRLASPARRAASGRRCSCCSATTSSGLAVYALLRPVVRGQLFEQRRVGFDQRRARTGFGSRRRARSACADKMRGSCRSRLRRSRAAPARATRDRRRAPGACAASRSARAGPRRRSALPRSSAAIASARRRRMRSRSSAVAARVNVTTRIWLTSSRCSSNRRRNSVVIV